MFKKKNWLKFSIVPYTVRRTPSQPLVETKTPTFALCQDEVIFQKTILKTIQYSPKPTV